jgi:hypothetical protein
VINDQEERRDEENVSYNKESQAVRLEAVTERQDVIHEG